MRTQYPYVRFVRRLLAGILGLGSIGCAATVPQHQRAHLADPTMQLIDDPLEAQAFRKAHLAREGAAGGDAQAAGGGCGCGN